MTLAATRPALTPVGEIGRLTVLGRLQRAYATSVDRVWRYERLVDEPGDLWEVTHVPTGAVHMWPSLPKARAWTGSPAALALIRACAQDVLRRRYHTVALDVFRARRTIAILDQDLVPPATDTPTAACVCGGYLAPRHYGRWVHVDVCDEELDPSSLNPADAPACPDPTAHNFCSRPEPVQCEHPRCISPNNLESPPCERYDFCCGPCCHGEG